MHHSSLPNPMSIFVIASVCEMLFCCPVIPVDWGHDMFIVRSSDWVDDAAEGGNSRRFCRSGNITRQIHIWLRDHWNEKYYRGCWSEFISEYIVICRSSLSWVVEAVMEFSLFSALMGFTFCYHLLFFDSCWRVSSQNCSFVWKITLHKWAMEMSKIDVKRHCWSEMLIPVTFLP